MLNLDGVRGSDIRHRVDGTKGRRDARRSIDRVELRHWLLTSLRANRVQRSDASPSSEPEAVDSRRAAPSRKQYTAVTREAVGVDGPAAGCLVASGWDLGRR